VLSPNGVQPEPIGVRAGVIAKIRVEELCSHSYREIQSAAEAYPTVIANAGVTSPAARRRSKQSR
jgi:hypothetical protein